MERTFNDHHPDYIGGGFSGLGVTLIDARLVLSDSLGHIHPTKSLFSIWYFRLPTENISLSGAR